MPLPPYATHGTEVYGGPMSLPPYATHGTEVYGGPMSLSLYVTCGTEVHRRPMPLPPYAYANHGTEVDPKFISSSDTCTNPDSIFTQQPAFQSTRNDSKFTQPSARSDQKSIQPHLSLNSTSTAAMSINQQSSISKCAQQNGGKDNPSKCTCPQAMPQLLLEKTRRDLAGSQYREFCGSDEPSNPSLPLMTRTPQLKGSDLSQGNQPLMPAKSGAASSSLLCTERNATQCDHHIRSHRGPHQQASGYSAMAIDYFDG